MATSTIAVRPGSDLRLGGAVNFDVSTTEHLKGNEWLLVYCSAYQNGVLVYGQLDLPTTTFVLGGGSSAWLTNGGPAECEASLWVYSRRDQRKIADCAPFDAAG